MIEPSIPVVADDREAAAEIGSYRLHAWTAGMRVQSNYGYAKTIPDEARNDSHWNVFALLR